ncbi:FtsX-like permease family protein [Amycolatopsis pigmentata]|uniref:FtsX-like permease family protein n=1 Tax=Amycolatopsis pigmentata TaxID=450801 RepID=A0ABW5FYR7_9PSEU
MFQLSLATFRERRSLFAGAVLIVTLGVALVQSSLLILVSAASPVLPPGLSLQDAERLRDGYSAAVALLAMMLAIATFLAVFIVASTFAFTVAQRRRDLALLRLTGAGRGQVRRLLLSEAILLGLIGTLAGVPAGLVVQRWQAALLVGLDFLPPDFSVRWQGWILAVSAGIGVGIAVLGVLAAARRASKVLPLEALRDLGEAAKVMTGPRWFSGILFLGGALALVILTPASSDEAAIPLAVNGAIAAAVGLSVLSPLVVPLAGRVLGLFLRRSTLGMLAQANLRDGVRRSASTAAPLLVLVALVLSLSGTLGTISAASRAAQAQNTAADLVVESAGPVPHDVPGVAVASAETPVTMTITSYDAKQKAKTKNVRALAVDPESYAKVHPLTPSSLADLRGMTMAMTESHDDSLGDLVQATVGGRDLRLRVAAILPDQVNGGPGVLIPREVAASSDDGASTETLVRLVPGADATAVAATYRTAGARVTTIADWLEASASAQEAMNTRIMAVLLGLSGGYAVVAVINAIVIAGAQRRAEFAAARASGLYRGQVVRMALVESGVVAAIGVGLGTLAAAGPLTGIGRAMNRMSGTQVFFVPWVPFLLILAGTVLTVSVTSVLTALSATRPAPVTLLAGEGR